MKLALKTVARGLALVVATGSLLTGCSDADAPTSQPAAPGPCDPPSSTGAFEPGTTFDEYSSGTFALEYRLSDGTKGCEKVENAKAGGRYEVAGKSMQISLELGDADLGITVDVASFAESNDPALALGPIQASMGLQVDGRYFDDAVGQRCEVTLTELTATAFAGSMTCAGVAGAAEFLGPFGGEKTSVELVSASGWWRAEV